MGRPNDDKYGLFEKEVWKMNKQQRWERMCTIIEDNYLDAATVLEVAGIEVEELLDNCKELLLQYEDKFIAEYGIGEDDEAQ